MQANLDRGKAALDLRSAGRFVAILAGVPLLATLALSAPDRALAACGASRPAGTHASASSGGSVHTATSRPPTSGGGGGGGGSLGCANGSSAAAMRGLPVASSGRVVEGGARPARTATHARTAATRTANTSAHPHPRGVGRPPHA
jgi:hypothetical protein